MTTANDLQVGGDHYKAPGQEEHWDRVARLRLDYFQGQITKYVERCWKKNGLQDLEKAAHFLQKYIELVRAGKVDGTERVREIGSSHRSGPGGDPGPVDGPGAAGDEAGQRGPGAGG